jgi:hypothetical protein
MDTAICVDCKSRPRAPYTKRGKQLFRPRCNGCRATKAREKYKAGKEGCISRVDPTCRDCKQDKLPNSEYCERHQLLRRLESKKQILRAKRSSRVIRRQITSLDEEKAAVNEQHGVATAAKPSRELYRGASEEHATRVFSAGDVSGNAYPVSAGRWMNRIGERKCAGQGCKVTRTLRRCGTEFVVTERGEHTSHEPTQSRFTRWTSVQEDALHAVLASMPKATAQDVWDILDEKLFAERGVTKLHVKRWLTKHRGRPPTSRPATLRDVQTLIKDYGADITDGTGQDDALLLPLPKQSTPHHRTRSGHDHKRQQAAAYGVW